MADVVHGEERMTSVALKEGRKDQGGQKSRDSFPPTNDEG